MDRRFVSRLLSVITATAVVMSLVALPSAQRSQTEGIKEAEKFVNAGAGTASAVGKAKLQVQDTLTAYNALVTLPTKDMKGDYKKLLNRAKDTGKRVDEARERVTKMEAAGDVYFAGRVTSITEIQDATLREKAQQRLDENKQEYARVIASLREAGESLQAMRKDLDNHITYLGSDLTPSAVASLKPEAQKLNESGNGVLAKAEEAMTTANKYFDSMRPTKA